MLPRFQIEKKLLLMKIHYFLGFAGYGATCIFLPSISKQRGYSTVMFSLMNLVYVIPGFFIRPAIGALTDRYKCQKSVLVLSSVSMSLLLIAMIFIPGSAVDKQMDNTDVLKSPLFWLYLCTITLLSEIFVVKSVLEDTICVDLLGDAKHKYGQQRVWGSMGWGIASLLSGFCVDWYSKGQQYKIYTPCFVISSVCSLLDAYVLLKIEIVQNSDIKILVSDVGKLFTKIKVLLFFFWIVIFGMFFNIINSYLFWYMEDLANIYHPEKKTWLKTIQGSSTMVQSFGGEILFFYSSSFILKRIGYINAYSLAFFTFTVKFCLYSIVENPVWIIPIELLHGPTFALPLSAAVAYAACIAPAGAEGMLQGVVGTAFMGIGWPAGTVFGGYLFDHFGSITSLKLLSVIASIVCITQIIENQLMIRFHKNHTAEESCGNDPKINDQGDAL